MDEVFDIELLPCPFCGTTAPTVKVCSHTEIEENEEEVKYFAVICDAATGRGVDWNGCGSMSGYVASKKGAAQLWNGRAKISAEVKP